MDFLEKRVEHILIDRGVKYTTEKCNGQRLDFYLPGYDVYIEVKQYFSERSNDQLHSQDNIILIQGKKSISFLESLLSCPLTPNNSNPI